MYYVVHPGYVTLLKRPYSTIYVDAGTLAANYGLEPGEYIVDTTTQENSYTGFHIHLWPRPDNKYRDIKTLEGDYDPFYSTPVGWKEKRRERRTEF